MPTFSDIPEWVPFVVAGVVIVAAIWGISTFIARKRTQALAAVASEMGFAFSAKDEQQAPHLRTLLFNRGHGKLFRNIMTGGAGGLRAVLFDYQFTIGGGRYSHTYRQTVAAYSKTGMNLPVFEIKALGLWQKIFGGKRIQFDSHPEFTRRYYVRSQDQMKMQTVFTPGLLSFLEQLDTRKKWRLEGDGETLIVYRSEKKVRPPDFRTFLEETSSLAGQFFALGICK